MKLTFLSADRPLTKTYTLNDQGSLTKTSAPMVSDVTSFEVEVEAIEDFHAAVRAGAARGYCLLKGNTQRPLVHESRAGSTDPSTPTEWLCYDLDGANFADAEAFMQAIGLPDVSYVQQWSSSHGVETRPGLRCHLFVLSAPVTPALAKAHLMTANLSLGVLSSALSLTASSSALNFPLDVTTCQNDKLIYIAPPVLGPGLTDPVAERIFLIKKKYDRAAIPPMMPGPPGSPPEPLLWPTARLVEAKREAIEELRKAAALPKMKLVTHSTSGVDYATGITAATTYEARTARGFTYFNLNGGDSWGYYHPEGDPRYIYNFKGEPVYRTQDIIPEYWASLQARGAGLESDHQGSMAWGFVDRATSKFYAAEYQNGALKIDKVDSEKLLRDRLMLCGVVPPPIIPVWTMIHDPEIEGTVDVETRTVNLFKPSAIMGAERPGTWHTIHWLINHVLGDDAPSVDHFLNWLAYVYTTRRLTGTAWLIHGVPGTGKGLLYTHLLTPLLGSANVSKASIHSIEAGWTDFANDKLLVVVDEMDIGATREAHKGMAMIKLLITEPTLMSRQKYLADRMVDNRASFLFFSNMVLPIEIVAGDRRFNVAPRQEKPLGQPTAIQLAAIEAELPAFAHHLKTTEVDETKVRTPLQNAAKSAVVDLSTTAAEELVTWLKEGDLTAIWHSVHEVDPMLLMTSEGMAMQRAYDLVSDLVLTGRDRLTVPELHALFLGVAGDVSAKGGKFGKYLSHNGLSLKKVRFGSSTAKGCMFKWVDSQDIQDAKLLLQAKPPRAKLRAVV